MKYSDPEEMFPLVDEEGNTTGEAPRSVCHNGISMLLHPVVHLHIFNNDGDLFLQKRSMRKDTQPGKWDTSVGGHFAPGEKEIDALMREAWEEMGITEFIPEPLGRYKWESPVERELVYSFKTVSDQRPIINPWEVEEGRFWTHLQIKEALGKGIFTPNFEKEYSLFLEKCFISFSEGQ